MMHGFETKLVAELSGLEVCGIWFSILAGITGTYLVFVQLLSGAQARRRRLDLIRFPDNWSAERNLANSWFIVKTSVEIGTPHYSIEFGLSVTADGKRMSLKSSHQESSGTKTYLEFKADISALPDGEQTASVVLWVRLDDGTQKGSPTRVLRISTWPKPEDADDALPASAPDSSN